MTLYKTLFRAYLDYLEYLSAGGERVHLPEPQRSNDPEILVHASALGACPLQRAKERHKEPPPYPLSEQERLSSLHLMQQGTRDAEPFQEALVWKYGRKQDYDDTMHDYWVYTPNDDFPPERWAEPEYRVRSSEVGISGRIDALLMLDGVKHIIEAKRRDAKRGDSHPQPKVSDCLQVMAYMLITGIESGSIIVFNRYYFNLWTLQPEGDGYRLYDAAGDLWENACNNPEFLNFDRLRAEITRQMVYLRGESRDPGIVDWLNDPNGWLCYKWERGEQPKAYKKVYQGKTERIEYVTRRCPYFCHFPIDRVPVRETAPESGLFEVAHELLPPPPPTQE